MTNTAPLFCVLNRLQGARPTAFSGLEIIPGPRPQGRRMSQAMFTALIMQLAQLGHALWRICPTDQASRFRPHSPNRWHTAARTLG